MSTLDVFAWIVLIILVASAFAIFFIEGWLPGHIAKKGTRVASLPLSPVMAFIDTTDTIIGVEIAQINARYLKSDQPVEVTFKFAPGRIYDGKVESVLQAIASGQVQTSGLAVTPKVIQSAPFVVRIRLWDAGFAASLPPGAQARLRFLPVMSKWPM